ncbi:MAG: hypothetical protein IJY62_06295 [Clostridia bacterium]|nr:hypothetical protein [Clostridia bacterium]
MAKNRRKRRLIKSVIAGALACASFFAALSFSVFAASPIAMNGGGTLSFTPQRKTVNEQKTELEASGFKVSVSADGTSIGFENSADAWGTLLGSGEIPTERNNLKNNGILSYRAHYTASGSNYVFSELEIVLDFRAYSVSVFKDSFLDGVAYALLGSGHVLYQNLRFSESSYGGYLTLYSGGNALSGEATLNLRGMSGSSSIQSTINGRSATANISSYALRILLPDRAVSFERGSLVVSGAVSDGQVKGASKIVIDAYDPASVTLQNGAYASGTAVTVE